MSVPNLNLVLVGTWFSRLVRHPAGSILTTPEPTRDVWYLD